MAGEITLTMKQQDVVRVLNQLEAHEINNKQAAKELGLSVRQVQRKKKAFRKDGIGSVIHKSKGIASDRGYSQAFKDNIVLLYENEYLGWNFSHFKDMLEDEHKITISYTMIRNLLVKAGYSSPKTKKLGKRAHPPRPRRENAGELLQMDASDHEWLIGSEKCHLHGAIDDCTGIVTSCYFETEETIHGYLMVLKDTIEHYGIPECLYTDYRTVFKSNKKLSPEEIMNGEEIKDTRFAATCKKLGISIISTMNPRAKGRIERLWETFQDRLVKELAKRNITTIKEANRYIKDVFLPRYNKRFASTIDYNKNLFIPVPKDFNYNEQLALVSYSRVYHGSYIKIKHHYYALTTQGGEYKRLDTGKAVTILTLLDNTLVAEADGVRYNLSKIERVERPKKQKINEEELHKIRSENGTRSSSPWHNYTTRFYSKTTLSEMGG